MLSFKKIGLTLAALALLGSSAMAEVTTIKYAFWGNPDAIGVEKDIIDAFEASHPDIKVTPVAVAYGDYHTKLLVLFAGGQAPDVMRIDSYFFQDFLKAGALKDISSLVKNSKMDVSKFYQAGLQDSMSGGKTYGLPWGSAPFYMFINNKMFADAGVPVPATNWTWDDFLKLLPQFSKGEGETKTYGVGLPFGDLTPVMPLLWSAGEDLFDSTRTKFTMTTPGAAAKINEYAALIKKGYAADPAIFTSDDVLTRYFSQNKVAIRIGSAQTILTLQKTDGFEFSVLPFPSTPQFPRATLSKSNIVGLSATTKNEKAAWEFLQFLRSPSGPGETLYMKAKRMPPTEDDPAMWSLYADTNKSPKNILAVTKEINQKYAHLLPLRSGWLEVQGLIIPQLQKVFAGSVDALTAMKEIEPKVQAVLSK